MRILIAEDEQVARLKLEAILGKWGYDVVTACDGAEALRMLQRDDAPSLAILDWLMPGLDGIEVCRKLRESGGASYIYLIMLTGKDEKQDIVAGMEAGADDYLRKPFYPEELRARVRAGERIITLQEALRIQASHDALTGIFNRGAIIEVLQRELERARRATTPVSVVLADLDHFKSVNDTHGHPAGDAVLRETARRLRAPLRPYDSLGRYGGEEFLLVLPDCPEADAAAVAERVRLAVAEVPMELSAGRIAVTVSFGTATADDVQTFDLEKLIRAADEALYRAKRGGRNRVEPRMSGEGSADPQRTIK